ncbi:MAG: alpha/beta hydrolase [Vicinamibacterales bacterium]
MTAFETHEFTVGKHVLVADVGTNAGPPVLLLHGIPGWRGMWRRTAHLLSTTCRTIAPDLLGFGESSSALGSGHAAAQAEMIVGLIRALGFGPVHLVGFDFGGPTAVLVCRTAPELVKSLVLSATNVFTDTPIPPPLQLVRLPLVGDLFSRLFFGKAGLAAMWLAAVARRDRYRFEEYRKMLRFGNGVASTRRIFQASLRDLKGLYAPVEAALGTIDVPCRVIWGDRDPFFPPSVGMRTAARIPGADLVWLRGCGHFLPQEDPMGFSRAVLDVVQARDHVTMAESEVERCCSPTLVRPSTSGIVASS